MKQFVFLVCSLIGFLLAHYLPEGAWSAYAPILISYHLYLAFLVFTAENRAGFSMPVFSTILTHSAFLALLVGLAVGRHYVPFFGLIRIFIPALAPFESTWLFSGGMPKKQVPQETIAAPTAASANQDQSTTVVSAPPEAEYTADEHTAWIRYLTHPRRAFRKPGLSVADEFKLWQAARAQYRAILAQNQSSTN
jgi:hypothetical protein